MRLLVCGSRDWTDRKTIRNEIAKLAPARVIHGAAHDADSIAANEAVEWALGENCGIIVEAFTADWSRHAKRAGPIRNAEMLREGKPDRGLAFGWLWKLDAPRVRAPRWRPTGTGDMVKRLLAARLPVRWVAAPGVDAVDLTEMPGPPAGDRR